MLLNTLYLNFVLKGLTSILQFSILLVLTRLYGLNYLGEYAIVVSVVQISSQICGMGFNSYILRTIPLQSKRDNNRLFSTQLITVRAVTSLFLLLLYPLSHVIDLGSHSIPICVLTYISVSNLIFENTLNANRLTIYGSLNVLLKSLWPAILFGLFFLNYSLPALHILLQRSF